MNITTKIIMKVYRKSCRDPCQEFEFTEGLIFPSTLDKDWYAITLTIDGVCHRMDRGPLYYK